MSEGLSSLKDEDIDRLVRLIESLDSSTFDYLQLQVGAMSVTLGKGAPPMSAPVVVATAAPSYGPPPPRPETVAAPPPAAVAPPATAVTPAQTRSPDKRATSVAPAGTIDIKSQIMGMFYAQPEPGAPPYVSLGAAVDESTTLCLIEVMKTFNAMTAGVKGVIAEICVESGQLVEYGQVLFRIRPS